MGDKPRSDLKAQTACNICAFCLNYEKKALPKMKQKNTVVDSSGQQLIQPVKTDSYLQISVYFFQDFLNWWYVKMPSRYLRILGRISIILDDNLSISLLFKNFFVPWHRDRTIFGLIFGIVIKTLYLPIAITLYLLGIILYIFFILIWLLLPIATIVFTVMSLIKK